LDACHYKYTLRPIEWDEVLRMRLGTLYEPLRRKALDGPMPDLEETRTTLLGLVRQYERMREAC